MHARYVHTNLIARDWQRLAAFYCAVFGCSIVPPERHFAGPDLERGTSVPGAALEGVHLKLPGYGEGGPTLELFSYSRLETRSLPAVNRPGFGHVAFLVADVAAARAEVLGAGGSPVGEIVRLSLADGSEVTWCYLADPEGNLLEIQSLRAH
jgi:catechol 2,3-dioxygenase-like lactoylglutathione lyase family enzyme